MEMKGLAKGLRGEIAGRLRLGTIIDPAYLRLGETLGALMRYYPMIEVKLAHAISGQVRERVTSGDLDCGFYLGRVDTNSMHAVQL
jgi:DNA-binding transcriptional LysR family regulator